jgi:hypothetical protein
MKKLLMVLASGFFACCFGLEAPYLISATVKNDSTVQLAWRDNDIAAMGFLVQRKDSTQTGFSTIDSVKVATTTAYNDKKNLHPLMLYTYRIIAYSGDSISTASGTLQVTMPDFKIILVPPGMKIIGWNYDTSRYVSIKFFGGTINENGYNIYRSEKGSPSILVGQIPYAEIVKTDTVTWTDSTTQFDRWYAYAAGVFSTGTSMVYGGGDYTYTFHTVKRQQPVTFKKISEFPLNYAGMARSKAGDSIILKETPAPAGEFTIINVKDPLKPKFDWYIDSIALLSYPLETLTSLFLGWEHGMYLVGYYKDRVLFQTDKFIYMYQIENEQLIQIDSLRRSDFNGGNAYNLSSSLINDTLLGLWISATGLDPGYLLPVYLTSTGFSPRSNFFLGMEIPNVVTLYPYLRGVFNGNILISMDRRDIKYNDSIYSDSIIVDDASTGFSKVIQGNLPNTNAQNTGFYLSPTENLCTSPFNFSPLGTSQLPFELFVSDIHDPHSYTTASENNAIYRDTVHKLSDYHGLLLDKQKHLIYLLFTDKMTILSYQGEQTVAVHPAVESQPSLQHIAIIYGPPASGVTILLPPTGHPTDLSFYDLSGRMVDRMPGVTLNAVYWQPKTRGKGCYFVVARSGGERLVKRFILR